MTTLDVFAGYKHGVSGTVIRPHAYIFRNPPSKLGKDHQGNIVCTTDPLKILHEAIYSVRGIS